MNQGIKLHWTRPKLFPKTVQKRVNHADSHAIAKAREVKTTTMKTTSMILKLEINQNNQQRRKSKLPKNLQSRKTLQKEKRRRRLVEGAAEDVVGVAADEEAKERMTMKKKRLRRFQLKREERSRKNPLNKKSQKVLLVTNLDVKNVEVTVKAEMTRVNALRNQIVEKIKLAMREVELLVKVEDGAEMDVVEADSAATAVSNEEVAVVVAAVRLNKTVHSPNSSKLRRRRTRNLYSLISKKKIDRSVIFQF